MESMGIEQFKRGNHTQDKNVISRGLRRKWSLYPLLPILIFILHIILVSPEFFPNLNDINPYDEASYINNGRELADGNLVSFAASPLSSFLYAPTYLLFRKAPFWFLQSATLGRFILFSLLWLSTFLISKRISVIASPLIMLGLLFVSPVLTTILSNPSDALFAAMSGFGLWQFLSAHFKKRVNHLWLASFFIGLSALARSDGLVLFPIFMVLSIYISHSKMNIGRVVVATTLPFTLLVGGYIVMYGLMTGTYEMGTLRRSYTAFEQGHKTVYSGGGDPWIEGAAAASTVYGTAEENRYSILNAIKRNPTAFLNRLKQSIINLPEQVISVYDKRLAPLLFILAAFGLWELFRTKSYKLFTVFVLWPATLIIYFITFFRDGYLLTPYFILFALASIGLNISIVNNSSNKHFGRMVGLLLVLTILSLVTSKLAFVTGLFIFLLSLIIYWCIKMAHPDLAGIQSIGLLIFFSAGLILRGRFLFPDYPSFGNYPNEKALVYLVETFEPGDRIATYIPSYAWSAKLTPVNLTLTSKLFQTSQEFLQWLKDEGVQAIYVEGALRSAEAPLCSIIQAEIGGRFKVGFTTENEGIQILIVDSE